MKTRYNIFTGIALLVFPLLALFSCDDKEDVPAIKEEPSELVIGQEKMLVVVGKQAELEIVEGNSGYRAFSLNEEVATVALTGSKLVIDAVERGNTTIIVSDASGQYRSVTVTSYYDSILVEKTKMDFSLPIGTTKDGSIKILQGNGDYKAESSDPAAVSVRIEGESLLLTAMKESEVDIVMTDSHGLALTIKVTVTSTTDPYDEAELEAIMEQEELCYLFDENLIENENSSSWYTMLNGVENGRNLYGWNYYGFYYLKIYFSGDKEVGKKENASLEFYDSMRISAEDIDFEIIKNDGEKIWAVYSFVMNERLYYGYFIQNINP